MSSTFQWMIFVAAALAIFDPAPGAFGHSIKVSRSTSDTGDTGRTRKFAVLSIVVQSADKPSHINTTLAKRQTGELNVNEADKKASGMLSHLDDITVTVEANGQAYVLRLKLNRHLFASQYVEKAIGRNGEVEVLEGDRVAQHCYYIGTVKGHPGSTAAVSTCSGIVGSFTANNETYRIKPVDKSKACLSCQHKVYRAADQEPFPYKHSCGVHSDSAKSHWPVPMERSISGPQRFVGGQKYTEIYIVNDYKQFTNNNRDIKTVCSRAKDVVNEASAAYELLDLHLIIVGMETWTKGNQMTIDISSSRNTLETFTAYRYKKITIPNDHAMLLTGIIGFDRSDAGLTLGVAFLNAMCSIISVSFVSDVVGKPAIAMSTMAHELGHSFGMRHDDNIGCTSCSDTKRSCIMISADPTNEPPIVWSECSKAAFKAFVSSDQGSCLSNAPTTVYDCASKLTAAGQSCD